VSGLDVSRLSPNDAVNALRSYPRRFRGLLTSFEKDDKPDDLVHRAGPDGLSGLDHADHAARAIALGGEALRQVMTQTEPVIQKAVVDKSARDWAIDGASGDVETVLAFLATECETLADQVAHVDADAWNRTATVAGTGSQVTALDIVREAVKTGSDHLRAAEAAIDHARHN
jgi:hypothetical protein